MEEQICHTNILVEICALSEYFVDISPKSSNDHVLIVGAQEIEFSITKVTRAIWISEITSSSLSDTFGNFPVLISAYKSICYNSCKCTI